MSQFILTFDCDSDAFADQPEIEIARLLRHAATRVEQGFFGRHSAMQVRDINGNTVGRWEFV